MLLQDAESDQFGDDSCVVEGGWTGTMCDFVHVVGSAAAVLGHFFIDVASGRTEIGMSQSLEASYDGLFHLCLIFVQSYVFFCTFFLFPLIKCCFGDIFLLLKRYSVDGDVFFSLIE